MADLPLQKRPYEVFISYSHADAEFVGRLVAFLQAAGLPVWQDRKGLGAGASLPAALPNAIRNSRSVGLTISKASVKSGWVRQEYNVAVTQLTRYPSFRIIVLRLDDSDIPDLVESSVWLDFRGTELTSETALRLLKAFYRNEHDPPPKGSRDIYVSHGWRPSEQLAVRQVCRPFIQNGYRLVGDAGDYPVFDAETRIPAVVSSCGALLAILPNRGGKTSEWIIKEIEIARELGLPYLLIVDDEVEVSHTLIEAAIECKQFSLDAAQSDESLQKEIVSILDEYYKPPQQPHYAFFASSFLRADDVADKVCELIESVTRIPCVLGAQLQTQHAQQEIIDRISGALFMLADITGDSKNTLIECGVARGARTPLYLVAQGEPAPTRFMFRDLEVNFYSDTLQLLSMVHRLARPFQRRILNNEFTLFDAARLG